MACGGLLPLLASATSPNSELEITDACQQELPIDCAASLLSRFVQLVDVFVFASGVSFAELEQEKNMPSGGVLRQVLRLISTAAVRHILTARVLRPDSNGHAFEAHASTKNEAIYEFVKGAIESQGKEGIVDLDRLLQDVDLQRIKGAVYRDMVEENRQAQFLALAVIYLLSVLMVSRYRDILEPPASPSPFFNSATNGEDCSAPGSSTAGGSDLAKPTSPEKSTTNGEAASEDERKEGKEGISAIMSETMANLDVRRDEEARWAQAIRNGRRRDGRLAAKLLGNMMTVLCSPSGAWSAGDETAQLFWRLDVWEDDSRRRRRFVPNVFGSRHEEASVVSVASDAEELSEEEKLRALANSIVPGRSQSSELVDESDIDKWAAEVDPAPSSGHASSQTTYVGTMPFTPI
ncbi:hypothetical protein TELCIR_14001 [Teladorsagia circumcincta]|uniref:DUF1088 domain-containing protein n=1 Tax=Teladorsagia circumcincta TaxID=45464 RepID=A0A2G9U282_TELCI|nr:hypothetical protein TELCIR_14001 [Teladorsagia circumcincta]